MSAQESEREKQRKPAWRQRVNEVAVAASQVLRRKPLLAGAGLVLAAVCVAIVLTTFRTPNVFAAMLDAMEQVTTAHIVCTGDTQGDIWISREHGMRLEHDGTVRVSTPELVWTHDTGTNRFTLAEPELEQGQTLLNNVSGTQLLQMLRNEPEDWQYEVSDVVLDGVPAKRIDAQNSKRNVAGQFWADSRTMRLIAMERWDIQEDGSRTAHIRFDFEYDIPMDATLFAFEPPADATIVDLRELKEDENFARNILDAIYAGSLSPLQSSLDHRMPRAMPDVVTAGMSAVLRKQFGAVSNVTFQSSEPVYMLGVWTVWTVIAEHGSFEMKLGFDNEGKCTGILFRASPDQEWYSAIILGVDYLRLQKGHAPRTDHLRNFHP